MGIKKAKNKYFLPSDIGCENNIRAQFPHTTKLHIMKPYICIYAYPHIHETKKPHNGMPRKLHAL